jgi:acyl-[acyl-carrier-protein] desaturase
MSEPQRLSDEGLEKAYFLLYRDFFDQAEKRRRWNLREDIPWDQTNKNLNPAIADVVETFCAIELYLPDYMSKNLPRMRDKRGRAFFYANWGYEESKHSMALQDWLIASGFRTEQQMDDLEREVYSHEWHLPSDNPLAMVIYGMVQELATWLNYRNLRQAVENNGGDPALHKLLSFITIDERAHHDFYRRITMMYIDRDRDDVIEQLRRVLGTFAMPALSMLAQSEQRVARIKELNLFDGDIFYRDIVRPLLDKLGIPWAEFRQRKPDRRSISTPTAP